MQQITVRFPDEWVRRIEAVAKALARPGVPASRTDAIKHVLARGLDVVEQELGSKRKGGAR